MAGPNFSYDGWHLTFDEEFDSLSLWDGSSGRWKTEYYNGDRTIFGNGETGIIKSWIAAKRPVELHLFEQGGHGFGMYPKETTSTGWFEEFVRWLGMHGMLKQAP